MRRLIFFILFFCIVGNSGWAIEREKLPIIIDIGLIKDIPDRTAEIPEGLSIGITITNDALYKLLSEAEVINAGALRKGFNRVGVKGKNLFKESGRHVYILETKAGEMGFRYEIVIDIQLDTPVVRSSPESPPAVPDTPKESIEPGKKSAPIQYDLSMYVGGRFIARTRKEVSESVFESSMKGIREAIESDSKHPRDTANPTALSIPVIPLLKAILGKKRASGFSQPRVIHVALLREDKSGALREVDAVISLQSRVIENMSEKIRREETEKRRNEETKK